MQWRTSENHCRLQLLLQPPTDAGSSTMKIFVYSSFSTELFLEPCPDLSGDPSRETDCDLSRDPVLESVSTGEKCYCVDDGEQNRHVSHCTEDTKQ
ncbi:hypothetical protein PoB_004357400 [Plakobranchus ocellatus]|uniref:Thyroglobulin type-1 domain-containing protein n=1 Tax=Plakobranchus ocellatus TaxID=259542 RepID=A0AAV4BFE4_9GAST|nr:hypothetical protein PoB_004357400 [Plakobranchus ocellatus]